MGHHLSSMEKCDVHYGIMEADGCSQNPPRGNAATAFLLLLMFNVCSCGSIVPGKGKRYGSEIVEFKIRQMHNM